MSRVIIGKCDGANLKLDVDLLLTSRLLLQANSGGGKSWLLRRLAEQFYGHVQTIIIDPEGEFYTLREKYGYVLVGEGGETPCDVRSASMLAERFLELKASAVCDLYEAFRSRPMDRRQWVRAFINALLDAPRSMWHPLIVIVDEAHKFCPQETPKAGNQQDREIIGGCKDAMIALSTTGRKRGFCPIWATQRLAKVDKDASAEMFNRMVGMTIEDVDVDRAADLMSVGKEDKQEFRQSLRMLSPGQFYAFGRAITNERKLVMVGEVFTHHPSTGMAAKYETAPPMPDEVKKFLPQLADLPKEAEDKVRTMAALQMEIRSLKKELGSRKPEQSVKEKVITKTVEQRIEVVPREVKREWDRLQVAMAKVNGHVELLTQAMGKVPESKDVPVRAFESRLRSVELKPRNLGVTTVIADKVKAESNGDLSGPEQRILNAIAWMESIGVQVPKQTAVAFLAGYTVGGGGFNNPRGALRTKGLIDYRGDGLALTDEGRSKAHAPDTPLTTDELHRKVLDVLPGPEKRILSELVAVYPESLSDEELAKRSGYTHGGGGYNNPRGRLRTLGLADYPERGMVRAADLLFVD